MQVTHVIVAKRTCKAYASPTGKIAREKYRDTQIIMSRMAFSASKKFLVNKNIFVTKQEEMTLALFSANKKPKARHLGVKRKY